MQLWHSMVLPVALLLTFFSVTEVQGAPAAFKLPNYYSESNSDPYPEVVMDILSRIGQSLINQQKETMEKRGYGSLDLGVGRGYSGSMAAKQLMGLASANYASGPGRKRRAAHVAPVAPLVPLA